MEYKDILAIYNAMVSQYMASKRREKDAVESGDWGRAAEQSDYASGQLDGIVLIEHWVKEEDRLNRYLVDDAP